MKIIELLKLAGPAGESIIALLLRAAELLPDVLGPKVEETLGAEAGAVAVENLVELAEVLPKEIVNALGGKLDPRRHPDNIA